VFGDFAHQRVLLIPDLPGLLGEVTRDTAAARAAIPERRTGDVVTFPDFGPLYELEDPTEAGETLNGTVQYPVRPAPLSALGMDLTVLQSREPGLVLSVDDTGTPAGETAGPAVTHARTEPVIPIPLTFGVEVLVERVGVVRCDCHLRLGGRLCVYGLLGFTVDGLLLESWGRGCAVQLRVALDGSVWLFWVVGGHVNLSLGLDIKAGCHSGGKIRRGRGVPGFMYVEGGAGRTQEGQGFAGSLVEVEIVGVLNED
jgi:hypothetical protein